jgi:hypothetical protein
MHEQEPERDVITIKQAKRAERGTHEARRHIQNEDHVEERRNSEESAQVEVSESLFFRTRQIE